MEKSILSWLQKPTIPAKRKAEEPNIPKPKKAKIDNVGNSQPKSAADVKQKKQKYKANKQQAIDEAQKFLWSDPSFKEYLQYFASLKKKDDAGDAILQALAYFQEDKPKKPRSKKDIAESQPITVNKRALSYDVGVKTLAEAIVTQLGEWNAVTGTFSGKYGMEHLKVTDIIKAAGSNAKIDSVAGAKLILFLHKHITDQLPKITEKKPDVVVIELQPGHSKKMLSVAYYLNAFYQGYFDREALLHADDPTYLPTKVFFQSAKKKLHVYAKDIAAAAPLKVVADNVALASDIADNQDVIQIDSDTDEENDEDADDSDWDSL